MAEEIKKIITVDTSQAVDALDKLKGATDQVDQEFTSMKDAKDKMDSLKAEMLSLDDASEEYASTLKELQTLQDKYNKVISDAKGVTDAAAGSYNALSKQMSDLKKAWKATADEAERNEIGQQILEINDKLKEFDASIGNYQRNVGNYASAFTEGLDKISDSVKALNSPLDLVKKGVHALNGAFKALIANPIGAAIAAIVVVVKALAKAFKSNEEASNKLKKAFSVLEPVTNAIKNALGKIANVIGDMLVKISELANGVQKAGVKIAEFLNKMGLVSDERLKQMKDTIKAGQTALQVSQELADAEIAITERKRKYAILEAKTEAEISELRAKAAEKEKYTAKQRSKFLEEAKNKEKALYDEKLKIAEEEFRIAKLRADQAPNSAEDNEALAQSEANLYRVRKEYSDKIRELNSGLAESSTAATQEQKSAVEESIKALEAEKKAIENRLSVSKKGSEDYFNLLKEQENKEWEIQNERFKKENYTDEQIETYRQLHVKKLNDIDEQRKAFTSEREKEILDVRLSTIREGSALYYKLLTEQENKRWEIEQKRLEDEQYTDEQIEAFRQAHIKALADIDKQQIDDAIALIEKKKDTDKKAEEEYYNLLRERENKDWEFQQLRFKNEEYTDEQIEAFRQAHIKALADIDKQQLDNIQKRKEEEIARKIEVLDAEIEIEQANQEKRKGLFEQNNEEYYNLLKEKENFEWEIQEARLEAEGYTNEQIAALREAHAKRLEEIDYAAAETTKKTMADAVDAVASRTASVTGMIGDLFSTLADNYDEGSKQSKAFQIASATMNMLGGVVSAVASAFSPANAWMTIYGQAAAAATMSATVIATGLAQIAKIKSTSTAGSSSASASTAPAPSTPSTTFSPQYTSNATGASDIVDLQNAVASGTKDGNESSSTRVYVVESDITESQNASKTRVQESEF